MKNSETVMLQAVWRKALKERELLLEFASKAGAQRARMQLYNAVAQQKRGKDMEDLELVHAAEQIEIVWANEERTALMMQRKDKSDMTQGLLKALGANSVQEFIDPEAAASAERMMRELDKLRGDGEAGPGQHQENPFYEKRE